MRRTLKLNKSIRDLPFVLSRRQALARRLAAKRIAVFLDYDGTLTPIVDKPEMAVLAPSMRALVKALADRLPVAIVSGRDRQDVHRLVGLDSLIYAGSHGLDIAGPIAAAYDGCGEYREMLVEAGNRLRRELTNVGGVLVECKRCSVAVHYRLVPEPERPRVMAAVDAVLAGQTELRATAGNMVIEIQPKVNWNKGKAVSWILQALNLETADVVPIFIGDDITDEDAFAAIDGRGIGVVVTGPEANRATAAGYRIDGPEEVGVFLRFLAEMNGSESGN
ncbi:MAG: trehalose-phosphatase [Magnetovibrio sp.]|nr:trehalose-phosphatase [Magnetovibrio sp.]